MICRQTLFSDSILPIPSEKRLFNMLMVTISGLLIVPALLVLAGCYDFRDSSMI